MANVIGVRFKSAGKVYYFDPNNLFIHPGDNVIVETTRGTEIGEVVTGARLVDDSRIVSPLKKVIRLATQADYDRVAENEKREADAFRIAQEKITRHKLEMKLVNVECTFDNSKLVFYFTANGRIDFRDLVKDLASVFHTRIELRQIGIRDEAKMLGGLGACGRPICCRTFLGDFTPVSIKMAKEQNLSLNPTKISGLCGRLMCCLKYEQDNYEAVLKHIPKVGKDIVTPDGIGPIVEINAIKETVRVRLQTADDTFDVREFPIADVRKPGPADAVPTRDHKHAEKKPKPVEAESESDDNKKKRYPHKKGPKNISTDQYFDMMTDEPAEENAVPENAEGEPKPKEGHRHHRSGNRNRHHDEKGEKTTKPEKSEGDNA